MTQTATLTPQQQERRQAAVRSMEGVLSHPSGTPKRWRAAFNHFLLQRPDAKKDAAEIAAYVRERRKEMDKFASTKNGRFAHSTPPWLIQMLKLTDPEYFNSITSQDYNGSRHLKLMRQAFPEFFYAEVI